MIDRVELILRDQLQNMRKFDGNRATPFQQCFEPGYKVVNVGDVGQHIIRGNKISRMALPDAQGSLVSEERDLAGYSFFDRYSGNILGRLNPKHWYAALCKELKQIAVVAGDLNDLRVGAKLQPLDHPVGIARAVCQPGIGIRAAREYIA